jgi:hypothetical protein
MTERPHKPVSMPSWRIEASESEEDAAWRLYPERQLAIAHDTAAMLVRTAESQPETLARLQRFVDQDGLETLAELWAHSDPVSLPRALFRLFQIRQRILADAEAIGRVVSLGIDSLHTIDPYVVGAGSPVTAEALAEIIDEILTGSFHGELAEALERAASLARLVSAGLLAHSDTSADHSHSETLSSLAWGDAAKELTDCAVRERKGLLN